MARWSSWIDGLTFGLRRLRSGQTVRQDCGKRARHWFAGKVRLGAEILEDRFAPAAFNIVSGAAVYNGDAGDNAVTVGLNGGSSTYQITDADATITLGVNATSLGWSGSGTNTITGPQGSVSSLEFDLLGGVNSLTVGASGFISAIPVPFSSFGAGVSDAFIASNVGSGINESTGDISITEYSTIDVEEPLVATNGNVNFLASGSVTIASQLVGNSAAVTAGSVEFDPFAVSIPNLNAGTMSVTAAGNITVSKTGIFAEGNSLSLHSGTSGTGNISFVSNPTIQADTQTYQAGDGAGTTASVDLVTDVPIFKNQVGTIAPNSLTLEQDAPVSDSSIPAATQFPGFIPPATYKIESDGGSVTLSTFSKVAGTDLTLDGATGVGITSAATLSAHSLFVTGTTNLNASVSTTTTQTYNSAVTLGTSPNLTGSAVIFDSTIAGAAHALTVTGPATFGGAVSGVTNLHVTGATSIGTTSISTSGTQAYDGNVTSTVASTTLTSTGNSAITFGAAIKPKGAGAIGTIALHTNAVTNLTAANTYSADLSHPSSADDLSNTAAAGGINLGGATLTVSPTASAVSDVYTIVQSAAGGITGTFAGLLNNSFLSSSGRIYQIKYTTTAVTLTDVAAVATKLVFSQQPSTVAAGVFMTPAVVVQIQDQAGNVFSSNAAVTLTVSGPTGSFAAGSVTTVNAVNGVATFSSLKFTKAGNLNTLTAQVNTLPTKVSNFFSVTAGAPASLSLLGGQSVLFKPSTVNTGNLRVQVFDMFGNPVNGAAVTFTAPTAGPAGKFNGTLSQVAVPTDSSGIATAPPFTTNSSLGSFTLIASLGGLHLNIAATTFFSSITVRV